MIDWLIERAMRTPYFHLTGYMERFWLVPYRAEIERRELEYDDGRVVGEITVTDGTGPVSWRRPLAWLLQRFDIAARVHHILRSDHGRDPHDHPWPYVTIVLRGGYWEHRYDASGALQSTRWHGPGSVMYRPANSWHMLELPKGQTAWTLFITGRKAQGWGFNVGGEKVPYWQYVQPAGPGSQGHNPCSQCGEHNSTTHVCAVTPAE